MFLERAGGRVYVRCRGLLGDDGLAEDAFQDAFAGLVRHAGKLTGYGPAVAWLYQTATTTALKTLRGRRRAARREQRKAADAPTAAPPAGEDSVAGWERQQVLTAALVKLPATQRRVVELVYLEGMTHAEAAAALGLAREAIGTHVRRGLDRLRGLLGRWQGAVLGAAAVEAALAEGPPALDRAAAYRLADAAWARAATSPVPVVGAWWAAGWTKAAVALIVGATAAAGVWWGEPAPKPNPPAPPPVVTTGSIETLQARNLRIATDELAAPLRDILQRFYPPDNPIRLAGIRAFGSEVEIEFQLTRPPTTEVLANRLRGRYCTHRRRLVIHGQTAGEERWHGMNPEKPLAIRIPGPFGREVEFVRGREEYVTAERLFDQRLPPDDRAESELIRRLFGPGGGGLVLPNDCRGVTATGGRLYAVTGDEGVFARTADGWRYWGQCPGYMPAADGDRLFCYYPDGSIWSRPADPPGAAWSRWCPIPLIDLGRNRLYGLKADAGRLSLTVQGLADGAVMLWTHPTDDPAAAWTPHAVPVPLGFVAARGRQFGHDTRMLLTRPGADPAAVWTPVCPLPSGMDVLVADGARLLALPISNGQIYARPLAAKPDVGWETVGRVHPPPDR